ncbi:hypothetical protein QFC22_003039 [Naganishia vaughanmartiniae]|uniref:Uncharacterized protein n=1 Tax=Naganishia vaughanmartiniae TaxID=1424756 RepID=A0ACC2X972_9TREE|nr:hypothetical protein QFC22_003039 [Naganishia vaughanmartiniae]
MGEATWTDGQLQQLRRQYFALYPIRLIDFETASGNGTDQLYKHQDWICQHILEAPYQPANDYQRKFLKALLCVIEEALGSTDAIAEEWELDDRLLDRYSELLVDSSSSSTEVTPDPSFKTYLYDNNGKENSITLFEAQTTIEAGSTGLRTWTASLFLAEALLHQPSLLGWYDQSSATTNERAAFPPILELGAGTGFLSIFLGQLGCTYIWSSDIGDEEIISENEEEKETESYGRDVGPCELADDGTGQSLSDASDPERQYSRLISQATRRGPLDSLIANLKLSKKKSLWSGMRSMWVWCSLILMTTDQVEEGNQIVPLRLDWFHSIQEDGNEGKRSTMIKMSQSLPADLTILATDVVSSHVGSSDLV